MADQPDPLAAVRAALDLDAAYTPDAVAALHNAAPGLRAALDELERRRAVEAAVDSAAVRGGDPVIRALAALLHSGCDACPEDDHDRHAEIVALAKDAHDKTRATARRHADARAALFAAYLTAKGDPKLRDALRAFFAATEEP